MENTEGLGQAMRDSCAREGADLAKSLERRLAETDRRLDKLIKIVSDLANVVENHLLSSRNP